MSKKKFEELKPILAAESWMYKDHDDEEGPDEYFQDYVERIDDLMEELFEKETEWKLLKIVYCKGLLEEVASFALRQDNEYHGHEVWLLEVNGKKLGISQFGRHDPCLVTKENILSSIPVYEAYVKAKRDDAKLFDDWTDESKKFDWESL